MSPIHMQGFNTSKHKIFISWDPVPKQSTNGVILGYYITFNMTNRTENHSRRRRRSVEVGTTVKVPVTQGNYTFKNLQPYTWYSVRIAAYTTKGTGKWSPTLYIRTEQEGRNRREMDGGEKKWMNSTQSIIIKKNFLQTSSQSLKFRHLLCPVSTQAQRQSTSRGNP